MRRLVNAHKERQALGLTPLLAGRLAGAVGCLLDQVRSLPTTPSVTVVLVPVPSAASAVRSRGFDSTGALARRVARTVRRDRLATSVTVRRVLAQTRGVRDQIGLDAGQRSDNLRGRLRVVRPWSAGAWAVLVDDVVTSGASLTEASRALHEAGIPVLGAATVAATVRFGRNRSDDSRESR